jgi:hypothetical protein
MTVEPKFSDCQGCRFYLRNAVLEPRRCKACDAGEHFEPVINDQQPDDNELMRMFARMENDSQD